MSKPLIKVKNLTKRYGKTVALRGVSFDIYEGITGLVGPNGAGKTTLINIIIGLIEKDTGKVIISTGSKDFREDIGVIRDIMAFPPELEVEYLLEKIAELYGATRKDLKWVMEITGLKEVRHKRIGALSMGYKKRFGIAHAVIQKPILIIADEPFAGLDPVIKVDIRDTLARLNKDEGINFFISSHDIGDLEMIADRVILINNGKIVRMIGKGEYLSVVINVASPEKFVDYMTKLGYRAHIEGSQVRVDVTDIKELFKVLYEYEGTIFGINMSSIEGVIRDEVG